ncbi:MAG: hypothetical protein ABI717_09255, partial [Actinomycetota bacterium]
MGMSYGDQYLARLANSQRFDAVLDRLLLLARMGLGIDIGVMVQGTAIHGTLWAGRGYAEYIDGRLDEAFE